MKKIIKDFLYHLLIILFGMSLFFSLSHINPLVINNSEPKEGDIVVLGDNGSMRLSKPEDVDSNDVKCGGSLDDFNNSLDTILYKMVEDSSFILKSGLYRVQFTSANNGVISMVSYISDSSYTITKSKVSNINTSDLKD